MTILYERGDVIVIPFPFIDSLLAKRRPAVVLSNSKFNEPNSALICGMLTSGAGEDWAGDVSIKNWREAGLKKPCVFRLKVFTIESNLVREKVGKIHGKELQKIASTMNEIFT